LPATFYNENANSLAQQYLSKTFVEVHQSWSQFVWFIKYTNIEQPTAESFDAEANITLPGLNSDNTTIDDLFEALVMQRGRLKEMQQ